MDHKKEGYLTIGEISRISGINPKSIRYYERIGAFRPAMVDTETGYRYYTPPQLSHLSAIKNCIQMGIPLRDFAKYYTDGTLHAGRFLQDAVALSHQKIHQLHSNLEFLDRLHEYICQADQLISENRILEMTYPETHFLVREIEPDISSYQLFQIYADLSTKAIHQPFQADPLHGKIAVFRQGKLVHLYAGINIISPIPGSDTITLPSASYAALYTPESQIIQAHELFHCHAAPGQDLLVFESEVIASQYNVNAPGYILRCISR